MVLIHIHAAMRLYSPEMIYGCKLYLTRMSPVLMGKHANFTNLSQRSSHPPFMENPGWIFGDSPFSDYNPQHNLGTLQ